MDNLVNDTNSKLKGIVDNLTTIKKEYEKKLEKNNKDIKTELEKVKKYKDDFFESKAKIDKMNDDIEGFEEDYQKLVDRFKDDELANILIAANKEISSKIEERKRKIVKDKMAMNELVEKAELSKGKLVKLTAEKKALELCLDKILDAYNYYKKSIENIISYSLEHRDNLSNKEEIEEDEEIDNDTAPIDEEQNIDDDISDKINNDDINLDDTNTNDDEDNEDNEDNDNELSDDEKNEDIVNEVKEISTINNHDDDNTYDESSHTLAINEIPSEKYKFNDDLDLENVINFDDSIEDENEE